MNTFVSLLEDCEREIRAGRVQGVAKRLSSLNTARIPREFQLPLANVCRRVGLYSLGMKVLARVVRPSRGALEMAATSAELAEYAVLLQRSGAVKEALRTLEQVDEASVPEAHLYRAYCHFNLWDYETAIPELERYLARPLSPYAKFVGSVNLAAALVATERREEALARLATDIAYAKEHGYSRLLGNCLELRAQIHLQRDDDSAAETDLEAAIRALGGSETIDQLFVHKWRAVLTSAKSGDVTAIEEFRAEALRRKDWESVREADLASLGIAFDEGKFRHLVFGTPFAPYRERIRRELGRWPEEMSFVLGPQDAPCLDVSSGEIDGASRLSAGKKCHQLLEVLLRDFYKPIRLGGLFAELFPGEHFDIFSSPDRIHQLIRRTRKWFLEEELPAAIVEDHGSYSVEIRGAFAFCVPLERKPVEPHLVQLDKLIGRASSQLSFTAREARAWLELSSTSFKRFASWAIKNGKLERIGTNNSTIYRLPGLKGLGRSAA